MAQKYLEQLTTLMREITTGRFCISRRNASISLAAPRFTPTENLHLAHTRRLRDKIAERITRHIIATKRRNTPAVLSRRPDQERLPGFNQKYLERCAGFAALGVMLYYPRDRAVKAG
ncbi:MAG: hypothetical protein HY080_14195 [Gammaproteobacteria bacterium]|nr:hypothetical protein [Gammaproteobacteria bacterium]